MVTFEDGVKIILFCVLFKLSQAFHQVKFLLSRLEPFLLNVMLDDLIGIVGFFESFPSLTFYSCHLLSYNSNFLLCLAALCTIDRIHYKVVEGHGYLIGFNLLFFTPSWCFRLLISLPIVECCKGSVLIFNLLFKFYGQSPHGLG